MGIITAIRQVCELLPASNLALLYSKYGTSKGAVTGWTCYQTEVLSKLSSLRILEVGTDPGHYLNITMARVLCLNYG